MISKRMLNDEGRMTFSRSVLITGGVRVTNEASTIVTEVELFVLDTKISIDLSNKMLQPRFKHRMIQLGGELLAIGGETLNGTTQSIEKFTFERDVSSSSLQSGKWATHHKNLTSNSTSNMAVTGLPKSSIECNNVPCECGKPPVAGRIVGGTLVTDKNKYPWIAQLVVKDLWYHEDPLYASECSATLIGGKWAVTAAHCVYNKATNRALKATMLSIVLGLLDKKEQAQQGK